MCTSAQFLCRSDALHVRTSAFLQARLTFALHAGHLAATLFTLHITRRALDHAATIERPIRARFHGVRRLKRLRHPTTFLLFDATPIHKLVLAARATVFALLAVHYYISTDYTVIGSRSSASTQAERMTTFSRIVASSILALPVAYYKDKSLR